MTVLESRTESRRAWIGPVAVAAVLALTQLTFTVSNSVSVSGPGRLFSAAEPVLALIGFALVVFALRRLGWRKAQPWMAKALAIAAPLFLVLWVALIVLRSMFAGRGAVSITMPEVLTFGILAAVLVMVRWIKIHDVPLGLATLLTGAHLWALWKVFAHGMDFRAMGLFGNINIYNCISLAAFPVIFWFLLHRIRTPWVQWWLAATLVMQFVVLLLSGSRTTGVMLAPMLLVLLVCVDPRRWGRRLLTFALAGLAAVALVVGLCAYDTDFQDSLARTTNVGSAVTRSEPDTVKIEKDYYETGRNQVQPRLSEHDRFTSLGDPDHDPVPLGVNIFNHTRVDERSINVIKEHWFWGTGRNVIYFSGYGYQPAHNVLFEALINFGILGAIPYLLIVFAPGLILALRRPWTRATLACGMGWALAMAMSLVQPLVTESLVASLVVWMVLGLGEVLTRRERRLTEPELVPTPQEVRA